MFSSLKIKLFIVALLLLNFILYISQLSAQVLQQDSLALIALYDSTNGDNWANNSGWKSGPVSTWHGVGLTGDRVTSIGLNNNSLSGKVPTEIGNLPALSKLSIGHNAIGDTLPRQLGDLTNLVNLDLSSNSFTGNLPPELGNLENLEKLYADHNNFNGSIPSQFGDLSSLSELRLEYNQLEGSIPPELGNLSNLTFFYLHHNQLSGNIPKELGRLSNLVYFSLSNNQLNGSIPDSLGNFYSLAIYDLSNNQLDGNIPGTLGNCHSFGALALNNNQLSGSIPASLGNALIQTLMLNDNQLTGPIPGHLASSTNLTYIYLQNNQLTGPIPDSLFTLTKLIKLDLSNNQIADTISHKFAGMSVLSELYLNNNQFYGKLPPEFGTPSAIMRVWLNDNQLGDSIPVEIANNNRLTEFHLQNNNFSYMPDMSSGRLHPSVSFKVENNFLDFEDLEPNAGLSGDFTYSPQALIGEALDTLLFAGDSIAFCLNAGGTSSIYHWYKDSIEFKVISDTSLILDNVQIQDAAKYYCEVTNTIASDLTLSSRMLTLTVIDTSTPGIPQNLRAVTGDSMISLSWSPNSEPDSIYYRIYMDTTSNPLRLIDSTSNSADTTKIVYGLNNNITYYFRLTAVDWSNNESGFSNEVYATPIHIDSIPPDIPQSLSATAGDSTITLTWSMVNDPDSIYYHIYMDTLAHPITLIDSTLNNSDTSIVISNLRYNTTYYCRVTAVDKDFNESNFSNEVQITLVSTNIGQINSEFPTTYSLKQNYPNPFNPLTTIEYQLPKQNHVDLSIYNMLGQKVTTLVLKKQTAGNYKVRWDAGGFAGGVYFYKLTAGEYGVVKKMILLK